MEYPEYPYQEVSSSKNFIYKVYGWMSFALAVTALVAFYISKNPSLYAPFKSNSWLLIGLFIFQLALVILISAAIMKISYFVALSAFVLYAISVGFTLSFVFQIYTEASIYATFLVAAGMFGITCLYGYFTKSNLSTMGSFAFMGLIGLILGGVVNIFLKSSKFDFVLSIIGVFIFVLLTAYDTQKIKQIASKLMVSEETRKKIAILGALTLYLDFINLFLYLLRFFGQKRED
jgi:FtsH-binding integral membrane protein